MKKIKIGIPRTNNYYKSGVFWKHFFLTLGCKIILSPETNEKIISNGENNLSQKNCFQNKLYFGHIKELSNSCDYILIYKTCSYNKECINYNLFKENIKIHMITSQLLFFNPNKIEIIEIFKIALKITKNPLRIIYGYIKSKVKQQKHNLNQENHQKHKLNELETKVIIVGNFTNIEDKYISNKIITTLTKNNIIPLFSNYLSQKEALFFSKATLNKVSNKEIKIILGSLLYYQYNIKSIIFLSTTNCQIDNYIYNLIKSMMSKIPITELENNNNCKIETKLELLIDTIKNTK